MCSRRHIWAFLLVKFRNPVVSAQEASADIVVCIDCTGSMAPCIDGVKTHIEQLVAGFELNQNLRLDWRVRLIEYRDLNEHEPIKENDFTTDIESFRNTRSAACLQAVGVMSLRARWMPSSGHSVNLASSMQQMYCSIHRRHDPPADARIDRATGSAA